MLASVAASPVSWPGPWHARVQPASEPVFQPLMAWLLFYCCARVGFACRCVSFLWLSVSLIRTALLLVLPCLCVSVFIQKWLECRVFASWIALCSCQVTLPLSFLGFCVFIFRHLSPSGAYFSSCFIFVSVAIVPRP